MDINTVPYQQQLPQHPRPTAAVASSSSKPIFEFTKRKKWDDLLLSELHLTIVFILSMSSSQSSSKILFTGFNSALLDTLGYNDTELVDSAFGNIMNERDGQVWQSIVDDAVRAHNPGTIGMFVRLKKKQSPPAPAPSTQRFNANWPPPPQHPTPESLQDVLFEIRGHVHFTDPQSRPQGINSSEPLCVLASATPYPSTVTNALNSFLEQKVEHERLLNRARTLRARAASFTQYSHPQDPSMSIDPTQSYLYPQQTQQAMRTNQHSGAMYPLTIPQSIGPNRLPASASTSSDHGSLGTPTTMSSMQPPSGIPPYAASRLPPILPGDDDDDGRRKKLKKTATQYVCITCGRTDSPEWRKGPQGPKTLCNACGLRWAKKARKAEDSHDIPALGS